MNRVRDAARSDSPFSSGDLCGAALGTSVSIRLMAGLLASRPNAWQVKVEDAERLTDC